MACDGSPREGFDSPRPTNSKHSKMKPCKIKNNLLSLFHKKFYMKADPQVTPINSLRIHLENKKPLELSDFNRSFLALGNQFETFAFKKGGFDKSELKLYVHQVSQGSIIIDLIEFATAGLIPIASNANLMIDFANHLKNIYDYFKTGKGEKPKLTMQECKDLCDIVNPVAKDVNSKVTFNIVNNGNNNITPIFVMDSIESNASQNKLKDELASLQTKEDQNMIHTAQLLSMFQIRDIDNKNGNKGTIEALFEKPLNIVFESEDIKRQMLASDLNPLKTAYIVDVIIQTINTKPVAYKILKLHETFPFE